MGAELLCTAHHNSVVSEGKAHLDAARLTFRGTFKLDLALADLTGATADGAFLILDGPEGTLRLDLGPNASKWADKINNPKSRLDKLGVPSGALIAALGVTDATLLQELTARALRLYTNPPGEAVDLMFFDVGQVSELAHIGRLRRLLKPAGALWILRRSASTDALDGRVRDTLRGAGFVGVKSCALSDTLTADKYVLSP